MGARGNSGGILARVLRGMSSGIAEAGGGDAKTVAAALSAASTAAYQAVMRPVEGTILTVVREAAEAAEAASPAGGDLSAVLDAAREQEAGARAWTPDMQAVRKEGGVADAGGTSRSEEGRVEREGVGRGGARGWTLHYKKKK